MSVREEETSGTIPRWVVFVIAVLSLALVGFYLWLMRKPPTEAAVWGALGDAVGPFAALFGAITIFAVLHSLKLQADGLGEQRKALELQRRELRLQRKELRLQRQEFAESREVMKEQKEQFQRTAEAQEALTKATVILAAAQNEANRLTWFTELAQRRATLASVHAAVASLDLAAAEAGIRGPHKANIVGETKRSREFLVLLAAEENQRIRFQEMMLDLNQKADPELAWSGRPKVLEVSDDDKHQSNS